MPFAIKPHQKILFTGDSITDCGRREASAPLGGGYVRMITDLIDARYPQHHLKYVNTGISGHTVRDLLNRWSDDVIRHQPDWLSIMIGINDLHRWLSNVPAQAVTAEEFATIFPQILQRVKNETKAQIILIDPFYMSTDVQEGSWRAKVTKHLPAYLTTVHKMVRQFKTRHVKMHDMFQAQLKLHAPDRFCNEPVHPNPTGHLFMAHAWLKEMQW